MADGWFDKIIDISKAKHKLAATVDWARGEMQDYVAPLKKKPDKPTTFTQKRTGKSVPEEYTFLED